MKTFGIFKSKQIGTPMVTEANLLEEDTTCEVDQTQYRLMIGKLQYVVHTRRDISLTVAIVARFSFNPRETHLTTMKRIYWYLKGTEDYGLQYKKEDYFNLKVYIDAEWAGNVNDIKRISGGAFFIGEKLIIWIRKKQGYISQSTTKAKYVDVVINFSNIVWIK